MKSCCKLTELWDSSIAIGSKQNSLSYDFNFLSSNTLIIDECEIIISENFHYQFVSPKSCLWISSEATRQKKTKQIFSLHLIVLICFILLFARSSAMFCVKRHLWSERNRLILFSQEQSTQPEGKSKQNYSIKKFQLLTNTIIPFSLQPHQLLLLRFLWLQKISQIKSNL